jgi:hypothetical protein
MPLDEWEATDGKQRAVWIQPGGKLLVNGVQTEIAAVLIESGSARLTLAILTDNVLVHWTPKIPIFVLPPGSSVLKSVALCTLGAMRGGDEDSTFSTWAVDETTTEINAATNEFTIVPHLHRHGLGSAIWRVGYHVTVFLGGRKIRPEGLAKLEQV